MLPDVETKSASGHQGVAYKTVTEGSLLRILVSLLVNGGLWLFVYLVGYLNFGLIWILPLLVLSTWFQDLASDGRSLENIIIDLVLKGNDGKGFKTLARVKDVPMWLFYPDFERCEWINKMVQDVWPKLQKFVIKTVVEKVDPVFDSSEVRAMERLQISRVSLGSIPPRVGGIKVYQRQSTITRKEVVMDLDLVWASDCVFEACVKGCRQLARVGVKNVSFEGLLRITLTPLLSDKPLVGGVRVAFLEEPKIDLDLDGVGRFFDVPGLSNVIRKLLVDQMSKRLVLPKSLFVPLVKSLPSDVSKARLPIGVLRVQVVQALDLMPKDFDLVHGRSSDPYAVFSIDGESPKFTTEVQKSNLNPVWNMFGEFFVFSSEGHDFFINVWDKDTLSADDPIGDGSILVSQLIAKANQDIWLELANAESGKVLIKPEWFLPTKNYTDFEQSKKASLDNPGMFSSAILLVYVDCCVNLPGASPSAHVRLSLVGQPDVQSEVVQFSKIPVFQESFALLVGNPESDDLYVNVIDSGDGANKKLGHLKLSVSKLMRRKSMEYFCQPYKLDGSGLEESSIVMSLQLLFLEKSGRKVQAASESGTNPAAAAESGRGSESHLRETSENRGSLSS